MPRLLAALATAGLLAAAAAPVGQGASGVAVYPIQGSRYNLPATQISFRGIAAGRVGQVQVVGSVSGSHAGRLMAHSDGQGASFIPDRPFARGEKVTVKTGLNVSGARNGTFSFTIAHTAGPIGRRRLPLVSAGSHGLQHYRSRPDLLPPAVAISKDSTPASEGDIFLAPQFGPDQDGPMIMDPHGRLIWFDPFPVAKEALVTDFREQTFRGRPVLTWWQGYTNLGVGRGIGVIVNQAYHTIATVRAGNGLAMDLHEFLLSSKGTAWIVAASPVYLPGIHKPVIDGVVQEIDPATGLVLFEWHALDHVPLSDSYFTTTSSEQPFVFDPYHVNSVAPLGTDSVLLSMRNTSAVYKVGLDDGKIMWTLGGKHSTFHLDKDVSTAFQHDALVQPDGSITMFDDGGGPPTIHRHARGIRVEIDTAHRVARLAREYDHSPAISTNFEGNVQPLSDGNVFMGWGQQPYFSEDSGSGQQIFDGHFVVPTASYRAYRFRWSGQPHTPPALAAGAGQYGATSVYASWNGATDVASWRVFTGASASSLAPLNRASVRGFETAIAAPSELSYFEVQALSSSGAVLGTSPVTQAGPRLALFSRSAFVSGSGTGAVPAECVSSRPCSISTTISSGRTVIARTGREALGAGAGGLLFFGLTGSGRSMLAHTRGRRLAVTVSLRDASGLSTSQGMQLIPFRTSGAGPHRSATQSPTIQIVGETDFVSTGGTGGILLGCFANSACHISGRLTAGSRTIATTGPEFVGPHELGYLSFSLNSTGRSLLAHAPGNQLGASVSLTGNGASASGQVALIRFS